MAKHPAQSKNPPASKSALRTSLRERLPAATLPQPHPVVWPPEGEDRPDITVVAPIRLLASAWQIERPDWEWIPVPDAPEDLGAALNAAARMASGRYIVFLPFGGGLSESVVDTMAAGLDEHFAMGAATCALVGPMGQNVANGFALLDDQMARVAILQAPIAIQPGTTAAVSSFQPDVVMVRASAFWGCGGFVERLPASLVGLGLALRLRGHHWRTLYYSGLSVVLDPSSPTLSPVPTGIEPIQRLIGEFAGRFVPDQVRTPDGVMRTPMAALGLHDFTWGPAFRLTRQPCARADHLGHPGGRVSIVVLTYNSAPTLNACLESVVANLGTFDELVLVDNGSSDETPGYLRQLDGADPRIKVVLNPTNLGVAAGRNTGIEHSTGDYVLFLDPDASVSAGWVARMLEYFADPSVGAVGPISDGVPGLQQAAIHVAPGTDSNLTLDGLADYVGRTNARRGVETKLLVGSCLMVRKSALNALRGFDAGLALGVDDLDLCWRLRLAGHRLILATDVFVHHRGGGSKLSVPAAELAEKGQQSMDHLGQKLLAYYGAGRVPSSVALWGLDWLKPSFDLWTD
ncbi:MAG: glycosyltransferase family 2 protein [Fimbriimonadaceae bacterium]